MKDPENKKKWIIDPEAASVVKDIFKMCLEGKGNETIARILQERQVLIQGVSVSYIPKAITA